MCGIIGLYCPGGLGNDLPDIRKLHHRGPDETGEWRGPKNNIYLGHTRLSILDTSPAGSQPMTDSSGRYVMVFNGMIYNHIELRSLLPDVSWRGSSDTETLIELYAVFGTNSLVHLRGMFAFAVYDNENDSLILVRDRLGIKPLWIRVDNGEVGFSSEIRPLLTASNRGLNNRALSEYIAFGRLPSFGKVTDKVEGMKPGSWIRVGRDVTLETHEWWPNRKHALLPVNKGMASDGAGYEKRIKGLFSNIVKEHLLSDVGVGAFLSGGIDSSIIVLEAGKWLGRNLKTFTVGFPQNDFDERDIARLIAQKSGSEHTEIEINESECLAWTIEAVESMDLPSIDAINTYIVSKAVRQSGLKVALSGLGGDELFGGYPSFRDVPVLTYLNYLPKLLRREFISMLPKTVRDKLEGMEDFDPMRLTTNRRRHVSHSHLKDLGLMQIQPDVTKPPLIAGQISMISWAEIQSYMVPMLLRDSDQMSMSLGLEIRVPFLDHRLVEEVLGIPDKFKKGDSIKYLLIKAFGDLLPKEVYKRPKQGFSLPMADWIKEPLFNYTLEGLNKSASFLNNQAPLTKWNDFLGGRLHWTRVWSWSILGHWIESNLNRKD